MNYKLLVIPARHLMNLSIPDWKEDLSNQKVILFTDDTIKVRTFLDKQNAFDEVHFFKVMDLNDTVLPTALRLNRNKKINKIILFSEDDILRFAELREFLGIQGQTVNNATKFRDKSVMKQLANNNRIQSAKYKKVSSVLELFSFIEEVGYPFILKPISGCGSFDTHKITDNINLNKLLELGLFNGAGTEKKWLAEEFIDGDFYQIDGLIINNKPFAHVITSLAGSRLDYLKGKIDITHTLSTDNKLHKVLTRFMGKIQNVFPFEKNSIFHIELFIDSNSTVILNEVACRLGGNSINEKVLYHSGIDLKRSFVKSEINNSNCIVGHLINAELTGVIYVPQVNGTLKNFPNKETIINSPSLIHYEINTEIGMKYESLIYTTSPIATFFFKAETEKELKKNMQAFEEILSNSIKWGD